MGPELYPSRSNRSACGPWTSHYPDYPARQTENHSHHLSAAGADIPVAATLEQSLAGPTTKVKAEGPFATG